MTYYEILQVTENASDAVIHMAYKTLAKKYHPDVFQGDSKYADEKMKQINTAFEILSDKQKRAQYDLLLHNQKNTSQTDNQRNSEHKATEDTPPKTKRDFVFPSGKTSVCLICILLLLIYIHVCHPYIESDLYDNAFLLGLIDFCSLNVLMMGIPIFIGLLKNFSPKGINILCAASSVGVYIISLVLFICDLIPAMLIGWIIAIFYYLINKHILLQVTCRSCSRKKALSVFFIILLALILISISVRSTYIFKNTFVESSSTNNNFGNNTKQEVEWISERDFFYYEEDDKYVLVFALEDKNEKVMTGRGTVEIKIVNNDNVIVYNKTRIFNENHFEEWTYDNTIDKLLATIYIDPSDIKRGTSSKGKVYFTVYGDDYYFDESDLTAYDLPVKTIQ